MPIVAGTEIRRLDDREFGEVVFETMQHVFAVHNELGRFFDERSYHREIAFRMAGARSEVPINVSFDDFCKTYYIDLLVAGGAIFELKTADTLAHRHRSQLMHYLLLTDLPHGKLVNMRPERVSHEFVNNVLAREDRTTFAVVAEHWIDGGQGSFMERMASAIRDWGTALDLELYEEAATHFCGRDAEPATDVEIQIGDRPIGVQKVRLADPSTALKVTTLDADSLPDFERHTRRFLAHTSLRAIQWINITRPIVQFKTLKQN
jgi:GxxExxY protein